MEDLNVLIINLNLAIDKTVSIPVFKPDRTHRLAETLAQAGGKGVNVARALTELGCRPVVAGFVSGHNGRWIAENLPGEKIPGLLVSHPRGESRICYSIIDAGGRSTDLNEEGPRVPAGAQSRLLRELARRAGGFHMAAVCGRMAMGLKKGFYARLTGVLKKAGCFTAFDTSGFSLLEGIEAGADLVKINRAEFLEIAGGSFSRHNVGRFFAKHSPLGLKALIVTDGPRSTLAVSQFGFWEARPMPLKRVVSPVGAGDSFMAGFVSGFMKGLSFENNLKLASGCAASDCMTLGAGHISRRKAEAFAGNVRVKEL